MKTLFLVLLLTFNILQAQKDSLKINKLEEVVVVGKDPISEKFSVKKIKPLDIYFNLPPMATRSKLSLPYPPPLMWTKRQIPRSEVEVPIGQGFISMGRLC